LLTVSQASTGHAKEEFRKNISPKEAMERLERLVKVLRGDSQVMILKKVRTSILAL
jgi:thymidine phosphorylase